MHACLKVHFIRVLRADSRPDSQELSVALRSCADAFQDKPPRSTPLGVAGSDRAWERASVPSGNRIQDAHIPTAGEDVRSRNAGRSANLHRAPRQTGHYRRNDWWAGEDSCWHSRGCRNRAAPFLTEWFRLRWPSTFRQNRPLEVDAQERANQGKFFRSEKKRDKPRQLNRSARHFESKEKPHLFPLCTAICASTRAIAKRLIGIC